MRWRSICSNIKVTKGCTILARILESSFKKDERFDFESPLFIVSSFSMKAFSVPISFSFLFGKCGYFSWALSRMKNNYLCCLAKIAASPPVGLADLFLELFLPISILHSYLVKADYMSSKKKTKSIQCLLVSLCGLTVSYICQTI